MKRGAEKQLSKDDPDDDIQEVSSGEETFKKADDAILATRKIRGLPKRSLAGTPPPTSNGTNTPDAPLTPSSKFGAFAGFGSSASNANLFSFASPTEPPGFAASPSQQPQSFSQSGTSPSSSSSTFSSSTPTVAPTASNAAKAFASFVGDSASKPSSSSPNPPRNTNSGTSTYDANTDDAAELCYYTSLRGLNISFLSAISKAVEGDPFMDMADLLQHYKCLRLDMQQEFDDKTAKGKVPSASSFTSSAPPLKPNSMPGPPSSFAAFGPPSSSSTSISKISSENSAFVPKPDITTNPSPPMSGVAFATTPLDAVPSSTSTSTKPLLFGSKPSSTDALTTSPFGTSGFGMSTPSSFSSAIDSPAPSAFGAAKPDPPSTSTFGTFTSTSASLFGNSGRKTDKSPSPTSTFESSKAGKSQPKAPTNIFSTSNDAPKPSALGGFGGFWKAGGGSGSIGNPVGFGFGSPPKTPDVDATGSDVGNEFSSGKPDSLGEEVGDKKSASASASVSASVSECEDAEGGVEALAGDSGSGQVEGYLKLGLITNNPHDEEGDGEEDEDTVHAVKLKAYKLKKEGGGWTELGYGVLRLKKHKENGARRMLLRNSGTGKININFKIYAGLKPSRSKKSVTFIGHDDDASQPYTLRLQSEEQAVELKDALDREIAFVKSIDY